MAFASLCTFLACASLLGIVITEDSSSITKKEALKGVHITDKVPCFQAASFFKERLISFLDKTLISEQNLRLIQEEILHLYREKNQHLVFVEIPEQDVTDGVVVYEVKRPKISSPVIYEGNYWLPSFRIEKALKLQEQALLNENDLLNNVAFLNQNPFHSSRVVLSPGDQTGETKVEIITKDRAPIRPYTGVDNTGVQSLGEIRIFAGFTWGDAFSRGDLFSYQFCTNQKYRRFHSHSVNYVSYLPWKHIVALYGGYAEIHTGEMSSFLNHAKQAQGSLRYKIPIKPLYTDFQSQIYFGADYKYETSGLFFVSELEITAMNQTIANLSQAVLGYQCELIRKPHQATLQVEVFVSPAEFLPHQSSQDYSRLRAHAKPYYGYATLALGEVYTFSNQIALSGLIRAQGSSGSLLPSEEFKLGGYNTVRGYDENVFVSDNGVCLNLEFRAPPFSFMEKKRDRFVVLAFSDCGWGYNFHPFDGITKTAFLWGVGPGLRYNVGPYISFRGDYGFKLNGVRFNESSFGAWHLGCNASY